MPALSVFLLKTMKLKIAVLPLFVFISIVILSFTVYQSSLQQQDKAVQREFIAETDKRYNALAHAMQAKLDIARGLQAFFYAQDSVSRSEFKIYAQTILAKHTDIQALNWLPRVTDEQRLEFETAIQAEGFNPFQILDRVPPKQLILAKKQAVYYPIKYSESIYANKIEVLLNAGSTEQSINAIQQITKGSDFSVSFPLNLIQETEHQKGILLFFPIFKQGQHKGFVQTALRMGDVVEHALKSAKLNKDILFSIRDITEEKTHEIRALSNTKEERFNMLHQTNLLQIGKNTWEIDYISTPAFLATYQKQKKLLFNRASCKTP